MRPVFLLVCAFVASSLATRPSFAQAEAPVQGEPVDAVPDAAPNEEEKEAAQGSFYAGDEAFDVQKYQLALKYFRESYEIVKSPNTRLMIARSLLELGRLDESYEEYQAILAEPDASEAYVRSQAIAKKERSALLSRLGWLTVDFGDLPAESQLEVGGRLRAAGKPSDAIAVTPGETLVKATSPDGEEAHAVVHLAAGREASVVLKLGETITVRVGADEPPQVEEQSPSPAPLSDPGAEPDPRKTLQLKPWAYGAAGVGLAGAITFGTFGLISAKKFRSLDAACADGICPSGSQDDIDGGRRAQVIANIGLGVGLIGLAGSVVLFTLDGGRRPLSVKVGPRVVSVAGAF